jgi:hypothetical protein
MGSRRSEVGVRQLAITSPKLFLLAMCGGISPPGSLSPFNLGSTHGYLDLVAVPRWNLVDHVFAVKNYVHANNSVSSLLQ